MYSHLRNITLDDDEIKHLKEFCNKQNFYAILRLALAVDLMNSALFKRLNNIRDERGL